MDENYSLKRIFGITEIQNNWRRKECINLIASESILSPLAEKFFLSDFEGRYNEHDAEPHYQGTKYSMEIEEVCNHIFKKNFGTKFVDTRPISGGIANLIAYTAFTKPGEIIISLGIPNGAHVSSTRWGLAGVHGLNNVDMVFDKEKMNIDVDGTVRLIKKVNPGLVMFGGSMFLFPEPVKEIKEQIDSNVKIIYDGAHVFGLIYSGRFQQPLKEGADLLSSSTHKTFQGPQGGIIIARQGFPEEDWKKVQRAIFPGTLSSTHIHRLPSLAITALEMNKFGKDYADQTIRNAKVLAQSLYENGFKVLCPNLGFTESHQIVVDVRDLGGGKSVAEKLEENNIICNKMALPTDNSNDATNNPSGIRLGSQEMTRWGMKESDIKEIARLFNNILVKQKGAKEDVERLKKQFSEIQYCFK
ncbi:serine hydroxymethyltransferase [Candidatus Bathyarchaeota archaeon]|nr:serine hydroxymethyltransferase [Candidatus Bathyarchaeota archaeon]